MNNKSWLNIFSENDITKEVDFKNRRQIITTMGLSLGAIASSSLLPMTATACNINIDRNPQQLKPNSLNEISRYNNYYEFSTNKEVIHVLAKELKTEPWTLTVEGEVKKPLTIDIDSLMKKFGSEDRIYPLRCVEGWSMVIPWQGFSLCHLIDLAQPNSDARYVEFISLHRPEEMIGQRGGGLEWPYKEALRLDEALHPLSFLATGMYGKSIPSQNGAPLRLVIPWKYGFKSSKAITHIRFLKERPQTSWNIAAASEYGFYANVNPHVAHPRWSQKRENRIGEIRKKRTLMFNGYEKQVAHLYKGMDLSVNF